MPYLLTVLGAWAVLTGLLAWAGAAHAWTDDPAGRRAARDALRDFETALDSDASATQTLTRWCADHRMADPPIIRALPARGRVKIASPEVRRLLRAGPREAVRYRGVKLACGDHVLSEADNWYRPGQLTPEMNERLARTTTPFGAVVKPLNFGRRTLAVDWLFDPPAAPREHPASNGSLVLPRHLLRHSAVLVSGAGVPFSVVVETYTSDVLAFQAGSAP
jgi:chorismate-pyruvate lyase